MQNLKIIKLVSGEEVIADIKINDDLLVFELTNAVQLRIVPSMSGQPQMALYPFPIGSNDKDMIISERHILYCVNPADDLVEQYKQIFSEIITPKQSVII